MTCTILCPGPSLQHALRHVEGERIAVTQAWPIPHQWLVALDIGAMQWPDMSTTAVGICSVAPPARMPAVRWLGVTELPFGIEPTHYSACAALALAWHLGHRSIRVVGRDMRGDIYFGGRNRPQLDPNRWEVERAQWKGIASQITAAGGTIEEYHG